jgi:hypothetical protein
VLEVILSLDYEIHGNGQGSPLELMVDPTARMLRQLDRHGAKLTIMADTVEIVRFRRHAQETGRDDYAYGSIAEQLCRAIGTGHDVQLHLHPAYARARKGPGGWELDYAEYDLAGLPYDRMDELICEGRDFLEALLRPVDASYECVGFRAANWSMQPSADIVRALLANGIRVDSSVFKHGRRSGIVRFDYSHAHSALAPWRVDPTDVCRADAAGELLEFPIYCEPRRLHRFLSIQRMYRAGQSRMHPVPGSGPAAGSARTTGRMRRGLLLVAGRHAWKLDFNQCSGRQLIAGLERAARHTASRDRTVPLVLIGHSKLFTRFNERSLEPFLAHVAAHPDRFRFATLHEALRTNEASAAVLGA